jgi:hypothetical protein
MLYFIFLRCKTLKLHFYTLFVERENFRFFLLWLNLVLRKFSKMVLMYRTINNMKKITKNTKWKHTIYFFVYKMEELRKNIFTFQSSDFCVSNHFESTVRNKYLFLNQFGPWIVFNEHLKKL